MSKHYDVAVIGTSIGALACAALLARRSFRVCVVGQGHKPAIYTYGGLPLARRSFTFLSSASPAFSRILIELAQSQSFKRKTETLDPMLQVLLEGRRLEFPPDTALFGREIDREFPEVRRVVDELYGELARVNGAADATFERDVTWSPSGFWEKRETLRALSLLPHIEREGYDLLSEFPRAHAFRDVVVATARFATHLAGTLPPIALARLHGAWTRGLTQLARGEEDLVDFFLARVQAHGGEVNLQDRVASVAVKSSRVAGVWIAGDEAPTGSQFVVTDLGARDLLDLAPDFAPGGRALEAMPNVLPAAFRFVVSMLVRKAGVPEALARESFILPQDPEQAIHLQRTSPEGCPKDHELLVAEIITREVETTKLRARVMRTIEAFLPYIERHYVLVDSPHDGFPVFDYRSGEREKIDRGLLRSGGGSPHAESMIPQFDVLPTSLFGLGGEPSKVPLRGAFTVGPSALPALGQEGELLAAWGAARTITRTDRRKEKMRREMWSKIELG